MTIGLVMTGRGEASVMVNGPVPGMLKLIALVSPLMLAFPIACRSEPSPVSLVLVTARQPLVLLVLFPDALLVLMFVFAGWRKRTVSDSVFSGMQSGLMTTPTILVVSPTLNVRVP